MRCGCGCGGEAEPRRKRRGTGQGVPMYGRDGARPSAHRLERLEVLEALEPLAYQHLPPTNTYQPTPSAPPAHRLERLEVLEALEPLAYQRLPPANTYQPTPSATLRSPSRETRSARTASLPAPATRQHLPPISYQPTATSYQLKTNSVEFGLDLFRKIGDTGVFTRD